MMIMTSMMLIDMDRTSRATSLNILANTLIMAWASQPLSRYHTPVRMRDTRYLSMTFVIQLTTETTMLLTMLIWELDIGMAGLPPPRGILVSHRRRDRVFIIRMACLRPFPPIHMHTTVISICSLHRTARPSHTRHPPPMPL